MLGYVSGGLLKTFYRLIVWQTDHPLAKAMAAVHRAIFCCNDQSGIRVFVQDAIALVVLVVTVGVASGFSHVTRENQFVCFGDSQLANRVIRIVRIDQVQIVAGNIHRVPIGNLL